MYEMENKIHVPKHQPVIDDLPRRDTWANQPDTLQKIKGPDNPTCQAFM